MDGIKLEAAIFHQRPAPVIGKAVPTPLGSMNYNILRELIQLGNFLKLNRGAEVGVFEGETSEYLLRNFSGLELYCVDPYAAYIEHESDKTSAKLMECENKARARLQPFAERAIFIRDYSVQAARTIEDKSLDFVFIDAIHSYDAVREDLNAWYPKVRDGGLVSGHDFSWGGVREAVEEFAAINQKAAYFTPSTSDVWFFTK